MSDPLKHHHLVRLLEHQGWVRDLARRLVSDPAQADDVAQDVWLAALEHAPAVPAADRPTGQARSWLGAVTRNAARQLRRAESRRSDREAQAAGSEALPSAAELVERSALQRQVAEAVEQLAEPYRSTLLLRYFEELPPREIARKQGVPVETVRTRLTRGTALLRERLDEEFGDRATWMAALTPLVALPPAAVGPPVAGPGVATPGAAAPGSPAIPGSSLPLTPIGPLAAGAALMNTKLTLSLVGASILGIGAWMATRPDDGPAKPAVFAAPEQTAPQPDALVPERAEAFTPAASSERAAAEVVPAVSVPEPAPAVASLDPLIAGRVLGPNAEGLAGVRVGSTEDHHGDLAVVSGGGGRFELSVPTIGSAGVEFERQLDLGSLDAAWTTVYGSAWRANGQNEPVIVVAPRTELNGVVQDENGAPLAGVGVHVYMPEGFRSGFGLVLDNVRARTWKCESGPTGAFEMPPLPLVEGANIQVVHEGYEPWKQELSEHAGGTVVVALEPRGTGDDAIAGEVRGPLGVPVAGATVQFGAAQTLSGEDGSFRLSLTASPWMEGVDLSAFAGVELSKASGESLIAVAPGFLPAELAAPESGSWPEHVVLTMGGEPFGLRGVVLDHTGEALSSAQVWVHDPTPLGEAWTHQEAVMSGSNNMWTQAFVDDDGSFELRGLLNRDYMLRAIDTETLIMADFGPFPASPPSATGAVGGRAVSLQLPTDRLHPLVSGRVVSIRGEPLAGISVHPQCDPQVVTIGGGTSVSHRSRSAVTTDAEGYFEFDNVPDSLVYLRLDGDGIMPAEFGRVRSGEGLSGLPGESITELEIEVVQRTHVRVVLSAAGSADGFSVLDADGEPLTLNLMQASGRSSSRRMPLRAEGRSDVLALAETGVVVVIYSEDVEVGRAPVELIPGEVVDVVF